MKKPPTMDDLNRMTLDYCLRDEDNAGRMLRVAADGGPETIKKMAAECRARGIDPVKAIEKEIKRSSDLWKVLRSK